MGRKGKGKKKKKQRPEIKIKEVNSTEPKPPEVSIQTEILFSKAMASKSENTISVELQNVFKEIAKESNLILQEKKISLSPD